MPPSPQEHYPAQDKPDSANQSEPMANENFRTHMKGGEAVVISGMSGLYPQSRHIKDFSDILYNKVNPVTSEGVRYNNKHPEVVQYAGSLPDIDRFDAQFFKTHYHQANVCDSMCRKLLEQAFQAVYDSGINPIELSGKKVGVYIGTSFSENESTGICNSTSLTGFGISGASRTMFANRISYCLNTKGPSMAVDESCCSSFKALQLGYEAINRGDCEGAIVGSAYLCLHPQSAILEGRNLKICPDGKTKSFAQNADGCSRSEAINVLFLQKAKDAVRVYADVLHADCQFMGMLPGKIGPKFGFDRNPTMTTAFLKKFYDNARVSPLAIEYVEAFGCANPEADKAELEAIEEVFCKDREDPLLIGSVMSNIGYGDAASGISAITKVLLGYHKGEMAANLHCSEPRHDVAGLREGRMRVVTEHQHFGRSYTAVNGLSTSGSNAHVLLHGHYKPKDLDRYKINIPRLVTISTRQESSLKYIFDDLKSHPIDPEELALLQNIHQKEIPGHLGRGFIILDTDEEQNTVSLCENAKHYDAARRPLWFVYSGMGSQWAGMGAQLMQIPIFAAAIDRCAKVLEPKGINIHHILTSTDNTMFDNILHSFVGIAAVQIGLTDILHAIGLVPDGIIGHSVGELGCAYADGCLTAEEMILSAYSRGLVSLQTPFIRGSMAAIGLGYKQILPLCPPGIVVACHNSSESSTISGPAEAMREFVEKLTKQGVFAREVPCSNIAYHSQYIAAAGPTLLKYLKDVIKTPKKRNSRWLSTSVPIDKWSDPVAQYCSAEYHTNNLLSPVLFEQTAQLIPKNAVLVEVAPHGLLQAILKRSMAPETINIALTRRNHSNVPFILLEAIGKLYMEGYYPRIQALYPAVEFPVSTGTPHLSHLLHWFHEQIWPLVWYNPSERRSASTFNNIISLYDEGSNYLRGNVIRGQILYPFAAALVMVWDTLAMTLGIDKKRSVKFQDVHLYAQPALHEQHQLHLRVSLHRGDGSFEVLHEDSKVATGFVFSVAVNTSVECLDESNATSYQEKLTTEDVYSMLYERDYNYRDEFRSIVSVDASLNEAQLYWTGNWVTFIDGMLQLNALRQVHNAVSIPTLIRSIEIDTKGHNIHKMDPLDKELLKAVVSEKYGLTRCGGIVMHNIRFHNLPPKQNIKMELQSLKFIPHFDSTLDDINLLDVYIQLVAENNDKEVVNCVGITDAFIENSIFNKLIEKIPLNNKLFNYTPISRQELLQGNLQLPTDTDLVLVHNLLIDNKFRKLLYDILPCNIFVLTEENMKEHPLLPTTFGRIVAAHTVKGSERQLKLILWKPMLTPTSTSALTIRSNNDLDLFTSVLNHLTSEQNLLVFSNYPPLPETYEIIRKDDNRKRVHLVTMKEHNGYQDCNSTPDVILTRNVLKNGILGGEYFVTTTKGSVVSEDMTEVKLECAQIGNFNSLNWVESPKSNNSKFSVLVHYASLNTKDVKKFSGTILDDVDNSYGMDYSGITDSGERVMGIVRSGACSMRVRAEPELMWPVPAHWSLEDAATVPFAYAHAFYLLAIKSNLIVGMNVLIHSGAGALGQAAISIALAHKCQVFTTVSNTRKYHFLRKLFPDLKDENIGSTRDDSFKDLVLSSTKGVGCDIVVGPARENLKNMMFDCVASSGIFIDVSQIINQDKHNFGMYKLTRDRSYCTSDFSSLFDNLNAKDVRVLRLLMSEGIARGYVRPLSRVTYPAHDVAGAFKLVVSSAHCGRVLIRMRDLKGSLQPRIICDSYRSHLIICADNKLGSLLVDRLISRGAKNIQLHSLRNTDDLKAKLWSWQKLSIKVDISTAKLNTDEDIITLLRRSCNTGPLETINIILNENVEQTQENLITKIDLASRKLCPDLKYFSVTNIGAAVGKYACLSREKDNLPASMLTLPNLDLCGDVSWYRSAVDAVESALCCGHTVQLAHKSTENGAESMLQKILSLVGKTLKDVPDNISLKQLGTAGYQIQLISTLLRNEYNISYTHEQIESLTTDKIAQLEEMTKDIIFEEETGLATFYKYVDPDEILATTEFVSLPTFVNNSPKRDDEFDPSEAYLWIIPGMEGHHERFRVLCERLKLPALVLQPGLDNLHETPRELAQRYCGVLKKRIGLKDNFYLLGYESGVVVALELAALLEDMGFTGTVFCLGCGPDELSNIIEDKLGYLDTDEKLQNEVALHMFTLLLGSDNSQLKTILKTAGTWSEKVNTCVQSLAGRVLHSKQYMRAVVEFALVRIQQAIRSTIAPRELRSKIVLLRSATKYAAEGPRMLQQFSKQSITVHQLSASLGNATVDLRCAAIINQHLHPEILKKFEVDNICDSYLVKSDSYVNKM